MGFLIFLLFLFLLVGWIALASRLRRAEDRLNREQYERNRQDEQIAGLTRRVFALEKSEVKSEAQAPVEAEAAPVPPPRVIAVVEPPPVILPPAALLWEREPVIAGPEIFRDPAPPPRTWRDQLLDSMGGQEWEAVVGGNWLNKLGVLVLVIGIALLLGYEFTHVGPVGRVAIGVGVSLSMLLSGVFVERKPGYAIFARGLIGGGWAALYFTTYAMHALAAARIIDNPYFATALLLGVGCGMILHSLRYKSQTVSGLAYFIAFATLALSESTPFSVLALLPLAASLLYLANRFEWHQMAVFGLFATYATCASRPDYGAPLTSTQALFAGYWLLFEIFDLLRLRRSTAAWTIESFILPGNALGFLGLSIVKWRGAAPEHLWAFLAAAAALYLASSLLRAWLRPTANVAGGGYAGPITISAALAAGAILLRANGEWINVALLIEGQVLFLAGYRFGQSYLRRLAGAVFAGSVAKLLLQDIPDAGSILFAGREWAAWSPIAILSAAVFYINKALRKSEGLLYSSAASALIALTLGYETPRQYLCVAWLAFAALLFELGIRLRQAEFRYQAYILGGLGTAAGLIVNALDISAFGAQTDWPLPWLPLILCAALHFLATVRIQAVHDDRLDGEKTISTITAICTSVFLFAAAWKLPLDAYLGVAWLALGAVLLELGLRGLPPAFRWCGYLISAAGAWNVFASGPHAIPVALAALVCAALSARVFRSIPGRIGDLEREWCRDLYAAAGAAFAMTLAWLKLPPTEVALVWTVIALALFEIGLRFASARFRLLAHLVVVAVYFRLYVFDLAAFGDALQITYRTVTILPIIGVQYYMRWRYQGASIPQWESSFSRIHLYSAAVLGVALARFELGSTWAIVAWASYGLALFAIGFARKIADLRWQSYGLALLSFGSMAWILAENQGPILAAGIVIASLYCAQLIAPRDAANMERHARAFYSLLATLLLAILLYYKVSGGALTMVWAVEALALLAAGFPLRDRVQRLSGLTLFLLCVLKLFLYDLRELDTMNRILSFIVLGLILVGVSWMYTRFRDRIQRYL